MGQKEIDEEIAIIQEQAKGLNIGTGEDLVEFVKLTIVSVGRLISHVSTIADNATVSNQSVEELQNVVASLAESTQRISDHSELASRKSTKATRISLGVLVVVMIAGASFLWSAVPEIYKVALVSGAIGLVLPYAVRLILDEWRS